MPRTAALACSRSAASGSISIPTSSASGKASPAARRKRPEPAPGSTMRAGVLHRRPSGSWPPRWGRACRPPHARGGSAVCAAGRRLRRGGSPPRAMARRRSDGRSGGGAGRLAKEGAFEPGRRRIPGGENGSSGGEFGLRGREILCPGAGCELPDTAGQSVVEVSCRELVNGDRPG